LSSLEQYATMHASSRLTRTRGRFDARGSSTRLTIPVRRFLLLATTSLLLVAAAPARAFDPVTLMVLRLVRDKLISAGLEVELTPPPKALGYASGRAKVRTAPGIEDLRTTIDDGFSYLDRAQRDAVYERLKTALADPQYATSRDAILEELAVKAREVRQAHEALASLPWDRKQAIARQVAATYDELPGDEKRALLDALRAPALPLPADLRNLVLADIANAEPHPVFPR
jgi:hypothetical protein